MHQIKVVIKVKIILLRNTLGAVDRGTKLFVLFLWILCLGGVSFLSAALFSSFAEQEDRELIVLVLGAVGIVYAVLWNMRSIVRRMFKADENKLFRILPISPAELFWIKAIENVFWDIVVCFPIGCCLILSYSAIFAGLRFAVAALPVWAVVTVLVGILKSVIVRSLYAATEHLPFLVAKRVRRKRTPWLFWERKLFFFDSRIAAMVRRYLLVFFRERRLGRTVIFGLPIISTLLLTCALALRKEWEGLQIIQIFFSIWILYLWTTIIFMFSEKEFKWLTRILPLSSKALYYMELLGLSLLLFYVVLLCLLPSTVAVLVKGGEIGVIHALPFLVALFYSFWAVSVKYLTCPKAELGVKVYGMMLPILIFTLVFPPIVLVVIGLSCRFAQLGIRRLKDYEFN